MHMFYAGNNENHQPSLKGTTMFYSILVTALAIALTAYVWYAIGFAFCRLGVVNLFTKFSIHNRLVREIVFTIISLTVVPICALYLIVTSACVTLDLD